MNGLDKSKNTENSSSEEDDYNEIDEMYDGSHGGQDNNSNPTSDQINDRYNNILIF